MSNHYHLTLETSEGNLVPGMRWLQATFANHFDRLRGERGHLFQGRYRSQVSNRWLCEQLQMGTPVAVSQLVGLARR